MKSLLHFLKEGVEEVVEEFLDFVEDFNELITLSHSNKAKAEHALSSVRPAYLFAERIDNLIKVVFGVSILGSAMVASVWGFASMSALVEAIVSSIPGRILLGIVGISYIILGTWKTLHLQRDKKA